MYTRTTILPTTSRPIETNRLVPDVVDHGDGIGVEEHAFRVGETHAMLAEVRLRLVRIPGGHHKVCIIYIQSTPSRPA